MIATETALEAMIATETALEAMIATETALEAMIATETALEAMIATETALEAMIATETALKAMIATETALKAMIATETAIEVVIPPCDKIANSAVHTAFYSVHTFNGDSYHQMQQLVEYLVLLLIVCGERVHVYALGVVITVCTNLCV